MAQNYCKVTNTGVNFLLKVEGSYGDCKPITNLGQISWDRAPGKVPGANPMVRGPLPP